MSADVIRTLSAAVICLLGLRLLASRIEEDRRQCLVEDRLVDRGDELSKKDKPFERDDKLFEQEDKLFERVMKYLRKAGTLQYTRISALLII